MKILILANHYLTLRVFRRELIQKLSESHEVIISLPEDSKEYMDELRSFGARLVYVKNMDRRAINPIEDLKLISEYKRLLKEEKPDKVITYTIKCNIYGAWACKSQKIPCYCNVTGLGSAFNNGGLLRFVTSKMYKYSMNKAEKVFFENKGNEQTVLDMKLFKPSQTYVLNGAGVNLEKFAFTPYPNDEDKITFLFFARIMKEKGIDELFAVMRRLYSENYNCVLDVVGISEEDYHDEIDKGIKEGWLCFHGYQEDVRPFIREANCFVLPSWHEGMANTNLENASSGRPVITSNIFGCKESVIDGVSGLLCEPKNVDSLYSAMVKFLNTDNDDRIKMGLEGRKHMEEFFQKKKLLLKLVIVCLMINLEVII